MTRGCRHIACVTLLAGIALTWCNPSQGQSPGQRPAPEADNSEPATKTPTQPAARFERGWPERPDFFPIAVWLQAPANAAKYKAIGINLFCGLWKGPTEQQLQELEKAAMPVICEQNEFARKHLERRIIVGWMHGDEPDNAQEKPSGAGYDPPVLPEKILDDYRRIRKLDPTRPVVLNLGQGVAWDDWYGRGVRTRHPEDYTEYVKGADILSFDIYPVTHNRREVRGNLWYVGQGVERLRKWSQDRKPVWACIETTHIGDPDTRPTPEQIRSIVWMALIHGAKGVLYFAHEFKPKFIEAGILAYPDVRESVGRLNRQIQQLAPVLNSPTQPGLATVVSSNPEVPIRLLNKRSAGATYVFAIAMRDGQTTGTFTLGTEDRKMTVTVLGEKRTLDAADGRWTDTFNGYEAHLYRVAP
ncbi:MAG TPA: beta-galactosidase [Phycisphaerae bacterium]|nr:beta-galactosidase [Phycisphaerae bacterium]HRY67856.1 beta-galactosidase [Phycisphaerae bacterium]HSA25309.1 beta-galactosidase [Phycisphaerae bacterium]